MDLQSWLDITSGQFVTGLFIFVRFGALLFAAPLMAGKHVPSPVRLGLSAAMALILTPLVSSSLIESLPALIVGLLKEMLLGLVLGWTASLFFSSIQMAGEWLDLQSGFQSAQLFNPAFDTHTALLGQFYYLVAGLVFFGTGGYAIVIRGAVSSFAASPPGALRLNLGEAGDWAGLLMQVFWIATQLAAPVAAALFLTEIAIGLANRAMPQVNVMILTLPVRAGLAVLALALSVPVTARAMAVVVSRLGSGLDQILRGVGL
jgi:flagellar biosynthetic protein FliR